ncbi:hypothetical protein L227DRAFT_23225 [Lentinus tigrinus ALCF2SS1-6]|uniref:Uncharacterized protein n=1 Tax=Lentinus tigrinus ALCF2SS1-6 TaxID=1328759 RepID=A0A5C2SVW4_9APHY|nr:hypothetical protein L227DRAFT_23225 [Lentinus tigrinus ALCF2SS1-6]
MSHRRVSIREGPRLVVPALLRLQARTPSPDPILPCFPLSTSLHASLALLSSLSGSLAMSGSNVTNTWSPTGLSIASAVFGSARPCQPSTPKSLPAELSRSTHPQPRTPIHEDRPLPPIPGPAQVRSLRTTGPPPRAHPDRQPDSPDVKTRIARTPRPCGTRARTRPWPCYRAGMASQRTRRRTMTRGMAASQTRASTYTLPCLTSCSATAGCLPVLSCFPAVVLRSCPCTSRTMSLERASARTACSV